MDKKFVSFTFPGDPITYQLCFDFNYLCDAETTCGANLMHALAGGQISATATRGLLYACLKTAHPTVTVAEAGSLFSKGMNTVLDALGQCLKDGRGESEEEPAQEPAPAATPAPAPAVEPIAVAA